MKPDHARIRIFGSLVDLTKGISVFEFRPGVNQTVKDCIERLNIPHTEVSFITRGGTFVKFNEIVRPGESYFVYPECGLPIDDDHLVTPRFRGRPSFVLDIHLGKLARLLRLFGISADFGIVADESIVELALKKGAIILSRDRKLLMRKEVTFGYLLRKNDPNDQLVEVFRRYELDKWIAPFTRCLQCNGELVEVERAEVAGSVPLRVFQIQNEFGRCVSCGKIYWSGTHYDHMKEFVDRFLTLITKTHMGVEAR